MTDPEPNRIQPELKPDPTIPLTNLNILKTRLDSLTRHLTDSLTSHVILPPHHLTAISSELTSSIHHLILNATALIQTRPKPEPKPNIIELDEVELLAEHVHVCTLCGKGFKRDANLRMHMRAHGDQYKSPSALAKPRPAATEKAESTSAAVAGNNDTRFSCPYVGCNRNKESVGFKALKSVVCVKNHFKRSHCPKKFKCDRCHKSFAVVGDLRSHLRGCGGLESSSGVGPSSVGAVIDGGSEFDELLQGFTQGDSIDDFFRF